MIGSFIIPIGDLIFKLSKERQEETDVIEKVLKELDNILNDEGIPTYNVKPSFGGDDKVGSLVDSVA